MIAALIAGRLQQAPELRRTKDGQTIAIASVTARIGKNATEVWQLHAHNRAAQAGLMRLNAGDFLSAQGVPSTRTAVLKGEPVVQRILHAETVTPLRPEGGPDAALL
jgi:hypothetical protein